jgi:hypothetical protein
MLNELAYSVGRWFFDGSSLRPIPDHWVFQYRTQEFVLVYGWLLLAVGLVPAAFAGPAIGELIGKEQGYQAGLDVACGIIAFALAGAVINCVRMVGLRFYWIVASDPRSIRIRPEVSARRFGRYARWFFNPGNAGVVPQVVCGVVTAVILLRVNP